ncbi:MAG TPA: histidine kinase [Longimicrobiaceae bacterium]
MRGGPQAAPARGTLASLLAGRRLRRAFLAYALAFAAALTGADWYTVVRHDVRTYSAAAALATLPILVCALGLLGAAAALTADRFRMEEGRLRDFVASGAATVAASLAASTLVFGGWCAVVGRASCSASSDLLGWVPVLAMAMPGLLGAATAVRVAGRHREQEIATARTEAGLADARFEALSAQLNPHFLFNTLQSVSTLMRRDADVAAEVLARFGGLLRLALERTSAQEVTLAEELELLAMYTDIERVRFDGRLRLEVRADPSLRSARVPHLLLQPLVENAVRHGVEARRGGGRVEVSAEAEGDTLVLRVRDDGPGPVARAARPRGIGLANTRARLAALYGAGPRLELDAEARGGACVTVRIPLRLAAAGETVEENGA